MLLVQSCLLPPVTISRFLANICGNFMLLCGIFCNFMLLYVLVCTFLVLWTFYAVLLRIKFCRNLRTFLGKIILAPNLLVLKLCLFAYLAFYLLLFSKYWLFGNLRWSTRRSIMHYIHMCVQPIHVIKCMTAYSAFMTFLLFFKQMQCASLLLFY